MLALARKASENKIFGGFFNGIEDAAQFFADCTEERLRHLVIQVAYMTEPLPLDDFSISIWVIRPSLPNRLQSKSIEEQQAFYATVLCAEKEIYCDDFWEAIKYLKQ